MYTQENRINELLSELDSETLSEMLRFLSLELDRIVDEQRIQAMKKLVERIRRTREAEEAGSRQVEERRRRAEDELFRQVMNYSLAVYLGTTSWLVSSSSSSWNCPLKASKYSMRRVVPYFRRERQLFQQRWANALHQAIQHIGLGSATQWCGPTSKLGQPISVLVFNGLCADIYYLSHLKIAAIANLVLQPRSWFSS